MAEYKIKKRLNTISGLKFDEDLAGLHKPQQAVGILGKSVRFFAPSIIQKALMVRFLILSLQDMVTTEQERSILSFDDLWSKCVAKLGELQVEAKTPEELTSQRIALGKMFANPDANIYLINAIKQCFPDLIKPETLTEEAFVRAATVLIEAMQL